VIAAGNLIKRARRKAGLTQAELARRLGTTQSSVARLESPGSNPRVETLDRAVAAAGQRVSATIGPDSGLDETLIASGLGIEPAERLRRFTSAYKSVQKLSEAGKKAFGS
jgi:transcriptional regulator with XRE-family HTH domain